MQKELKVMLSLYISTPLGGCSSDVTDEVVLFDMSLSPLVLILMVFSSHVDHAAD